MCRSALLVALVTLTPLAGCAVLDGFDIVRSPFRPPAGAAEGEGEATCAADDESCDCFGDTCTCGDQETCGCDLDNGGGNLLCGCFGSNCECDNGSCSCSGGDDCNCTGSCSCRDSDGTCGCDQGSTCTVEAAGERCSDGGCICNGTGGCTCVLGRPLCEVTAADNVDVVISCSLLGCACNGVGCACGLGRCSCAGDECLAFTRDGSNCGAGQTFAPPCSCDGNDPEPPTDGCAED
jgi:hypothetical protein